MYLSRAGMISVSREKGIETLRNEKKRYVILIWGTVSLLLLGLIYAWSIFVVPLEREFGWTRVQTSMTYTISMICMFVGMMLAGIISSRSGTRTTMILGIALLTLGFVGSSRIANLGMLYVFYGVFVGTGVGLCYNTWLPSVMAWFPERSGFVSGIMLAGFGLGGLILGSTMSALLNSSFGWRNTFLAVGIFALAESVIAMRYVLQTPPQAGATAKKSSAYEITPMQMLSDPTFYLFTVWKIMISAMAQSIIGHASPIATDIGAPVALASFMVGMISVGNGCGRTIGGILHDRFGTVRLMFGITAGFICSSVMLMFGYSSRNVTITILSFIVIGLSYGSLALLTSAFINRTYGLKHFKTNYGINSMTSIPGTMLATYISVVKTNTGSYAGFFTIMMAVCIAAMIIPILLPGRIRRLYEKMDDLGT